MSTQYFSNKYMKHVFTIQMCPIGNPGILVWIIRQVIHVLTCFPHYQWLKQDYSSLCCKSAWSYITLILVLYCAGVLLQTVHLTMFPPVTQFRTEQSRFLLSLGYEWVINKHTGTFSCHTSYCQTGRLKWTHDRTDTPNHTFFFGF